MANAHRAGHLLATLKRYIKYYTKHRNKKKTERYRSIVINT